MSTSHHPDLVAQRAALCAALASIGEFRPGALQSRYRQCGKPTCHCAHEDDPGHGPKWVLTRTVGGKRRNFSIPDDAVEATREQVAEYHRFQALVRELVEVSEQLCGAQLADAPGPARPEKRGRWRTPSRRTSRPKRHV